MTRKSPYRHPVRAYNREGRRVDRYMRGEGKKPREAKRFPTRGGAKWRVTSGGAGVVVGAGNIVEGMSRGIDNLSKVGETVTVKKV